MTLPATPELRVAFRRGAPVYLPVNPTEYHGPHLTLQNDHRISCGIARDMHARLQESLGEHPLLLADDLGVGVEPCPGPGTVATPFTEVRRTVIEAVHRLADLGAERVVLVTFHGAPLHNQALQAGVRALRKRGVAALAPLNIAVQQLMAGRFVGVDDAWLPVRDETARAALIADVAADFHAGFMETSLSLHYAPESVRDHRGVPPSPPVAPNGVAATLAKWARAVGLDQLGLELDMIARGLGWYALRPFPGYTGRPDLANPESGAVFARAMADAFAEAALAVFQGGPSPEAPLGWLETVTLGGRVGSVEVPADALPAASA